MDTSAGKVSKSLDYRPYEMTKNYQGVSTHLKVTCKIVILSLLQWAGQDPFVANSMIMFHWECMFPDRIQWGSGTPWSHDSPISKTLHNCHFILYGYLTKILNHIKFHSMKRNYQHKQITFPITSGFMNLTINHATHTKRPTYGNFLLYCTF